MIARFILGFTEQTGHSSIYRYRFKYGNETSFNLKLFILLSSSLWKMHNISFDYILSKHLIHIIFTSHLKIIESCKNFISSHNTRVSSEI